MSRRADALIYVLMIRRAYQRIVSGKKRPAAAFDDKRGFFDKKLMTSVYDSDDV